MILRWFLSKTVRQAMTVHKHFRRLLAAQRDLLTPQAIAPVQLKLDELTAAIKEGNTGRINIKAEELQFAAEKWLKPYPNAGWRENVEVLLVALAVAMGIRTFFLQPFKIPTGSMQPTLFGVTSTPDYGPFFMLTRMNAEQATLHKAYEQQLAAQKAIVIPTGWARVKEWFEGISYIHIVAEDDGYYQGSEPIKKFLIFNLWQSFYVGSKESNKLGHKYTMWLPPDLGESDIEKRAGLVHGNFYHKGDDIVKLRVQEGIICSWTG